MPDFLLGKRQSIIWKVHHTKTRVLQIGRALRAEGLEPRVQRLHDLSMASHCALPAVRVGFMSVGMSRWCDFRN